MALILDGKKVAEELYSNLPNMKGKELAIITIGEDEASKVYVRNKIKACEKVGLKGINYKFNPNEYEDVNDLADCVETKIISLNCDTNVVGIMIQQPYPKELKKYHLEDYISENKDVDGLSAGNIDTVLRGKIPTHYPATPKGIMTLLDYYNIPIEGKHVVIIGRSDIVGKPLAAMMTARNATVTVCHSKTNHKSLVLYLRCADIIISAVGKPSFITLGMLDDGLAKTNLLGANPIVIDVGINRDENGKLCGDVDYDSVLPYISAITPVPGGVGPMTVYSLIKNCVDSYFNNLNFKK